MAIVSTEMGLRVMRESARLTRFEASAAVPATNVQQAIEQAVALGNPTPTPIGVANSPYTVLPTDRILLVNTSGGAVTINMQATIFRPYSLMIKDDTGNAATNVITVVPNGAETIDGLTSYSIDSNFSATTFAPQSGGYYVQP